MQIEKNSPELTCAAAAFEIVEVEGRGKIMRAVKDLLPGVELFREEALLPLSAETMEMFRDMFDGQLELGKNLFFCFV
jgi:hypothetical protein